MYTQKDFGLPEDLLAEAEKIIQGKDKGADTFGADGMKGQDPATRNAELKAKQRIDPNTPGKEPIKDKTDKIQVDEDSESVDETVTEDGPIRMGDMKPSYYINNLIKNREGKTNKPKKPKTNTIKGLGGAKVATRNVTEDGDQLDHGEKVVDYSGGQRDPIHDGQGTDGQNKGDRKFNEGEGEGMADPVNHAAQGHAQVHESWDSINETIANLTEQREASADLNERNRIDGMIYNLVAMQDAL